jgi:hypothetical protein
MNPRYLLARMALANQACALPRQSLNVKDDR